VPGYRAMWLEVAREQYAALPADVRAQVDARVEQLLANPRYPLGGYDEPSDSWTTVYGDGVGLIMYAVVHSHQRLIILRLV
jgi:hypothetical protein